jgi:PAS domain S-box-containing protein
MAPANDPERSRRDRSWTLALVMTLLAIVPIIALGTIAIDAATSSVRERVADGQLAIGRTLAEQAERDITLVEQRTASIAERVALPDLLRAEDDTELVAFVSQLAGERDHLRRLAIYDATGALVAAAPADRVEVPEAGSAQHIAEATVRVSDDHALVVLTYPIHARVGGRGARIATLVAEVDLSLAVPGIEDARFGTDGRASLALADGTVIVTGDPSKRERVLPGAVGLVSAKQRQATIEEYVAPGSDGRELAAVTRLDNGWFLVVTQPHAEAFAPVDSLREYITIASLLILLGGTMVALWVAALQRRAQLRLASSERRARQITEAAHNAFVAIDEEGRLTEWNAAAAELFGWTPEEVRGRRGSMVIPESLRERHEAWLADLLANGPSDDAFETTVMDRDGREFPIELTVSTLPGVDGTEYFAFLRDISERKQVERERADARRKLELANQELQATGELKNDFLAMASHELRTPLTSISGFAKTLRTMWDTLVDDDKRRYVSIIDEQADRLGRLVADLLLLSRIEQGGLRVAPVAVDVLPAIQRALRDMAIPGDVDIECEQPVLVHIDDDHLQQVLINLLSNAMKYGKPPIQLVVTCEAHAADGDGVRFAEILVEDNGAGVPEPFVDRLFERFAQAPEHQSDLRAGAGLGLSIVAGLVHAHGGEVRYERADGGGARFVVRLPISR